MTVPAETPQSMTEVARRLGLIAHLKKRIAEAEEPLRAAYLAGTDEGDVKKPKVAGVAKPIATISHTQGTPAREEWIVGDRGALIAWARANFPKHVITPPPVQPPDYLDPDFEAWLLDAAAELDEPVDPNGETGVPGIVKKKTPATDGTVTVRPDMKVAAELWATHPTSARLAITDALTDTPEETP